MIKGKCEQNTYSNHKVLVTHKITIVKARNSYCSKQIHKVLVTHKITIVKARNSYCSKQITEK